MSSSPEERVDRYSRNLAAMSELRAKIELTMRTLEMLVSALNSKHAQKIEADAKEAALFVELRQQRKLKQTQLYF